MSDVVHPAAAHHLPIFITAPGQTDVLTVVTALFLLVTVVAFGLLFLRLHSLPERIAHRGHRLQLEIVAILCLISLFTHIHAFWIAALLLAFIELPDVSGWMGRIAHGVERIAETKPAAPSIEPPPMELGSAPSLSDPGPAVGSGETQSRPKAQELTHA